MNIRPAKRQKNLSDWFWYRKWNETNDAVLENAAFTSAEEGTEDNMSRKLEDFTGVSGVTIECNKPQSVSEIRELIFGWPKEKSPATGTSFPPNPSVNIN